MAGEPRFHSFMFNVYDEREYKFGTLTGKELCELLHNIYGNNFAYVYHDKDHLPDGVIKKAHYHFIVYFANARTYNAVSKEFWNVYGIAKDRCKPWDAWVKACRYLTHMDDPDKFQYPSEDVICSFTYDDVVEQCTSEDDAMQVLTNLIIEGKLRNTRDIVLYGLTNKMHSVVRRNFTILREFLAFYDNANDDI